MTDETNPTPQRPEQQAPPMKKPASVGKVIAIGCGGLFGLLILIGIIVAIANPDAMKQAADEAKKREQAAEQTGGSGSVGGKDGGEEAVDESLAEEKWPAKGIGVSKARIQNEWGSMSPGFKFAQWTPVGNQPHWHGDFSSLPGATGVDIIGPEDDPYIVTFTVEQQNEYDKKALNATTIPALRKRFATILGPVCEKWVREHIGGDWPTKGGSEFAELIDGNRSYELRWSAISVDLRVEAK